MLKKIVLSLLIGLILAGKILAQGVDYYLPYPGILPDHPFYWAKMVRDRVQLVLTTKPQAKAEKLLLYADKRLGAAWALIDGQKTVLGVSTLTKAEKYLERALEQRSSFADQERLDRAVRKHREVMGLLKAKAGDQAGLVEALMVKLEAVRPAAEPVTEVSIEAAEETTVFAALEKLAGEKGWEIAAKDYEFGKLVEAIAGAANSQEKAWIYYVNGAAGDKASDKFELKAGDKVEWRYEAVKP